MVNLPNRITKGIRGANSNKNSAENHNTSEVENPTQGDVLDRLGVSAQTSIPENVMSSREAKAVRFVRSTPGYYFPEVEKAMEDLSKSLSWHESAIHKRDLDVHKLAQEVDQLETALTNQRYQVESLSVTSSSILVDENQQPLSADSLEAQLAIALEEKRAAQEQVASLVAETQSLQALVDQAKEYTEYQDGQIATLEEALAAAGQGEPAPLSLPPVPAQEDDALTLATLEAELSAKTAELEALNATNAEMSAQVESMQSQIVSLSSGDTSGLSEAYEELQQWADEVTPRYEEAVAQASSLETEVASLRGQVAVLEDKLAQSKEYSESLERFAEETNAYIDTLLNTTDSAVNAHAEVVEVAQQYIAHTVDPEEPALQEEIPVSNGYGVEEPTEEVRIPVPTSVNSGPRIVHGNSGGEEDDNFSSVLSDLLQPEVSPEQMARLKQSRPTLQYAVAKPGAPLTSLRPGESAEDIL